MLNGRGEVPPGMKPWYAIPVFNYQQGYFSASIEPTYIGSADRFDEVPEMTAAQKEAMRVVRAISDELRFDTEFSRGAVEEIDRPGGNVGPDTVLEAPIARQ